jgi:uncharacterized protein (DUF1330 family)
MNWKVVGAALAGMAIGAAGGGMAMHAAQTKVAPGYIVAEVEVTDAAAFQPYAQQAPPIVAAHGGRYLVRGGAVTPVEGDAPKRLTVIAFDSVEKAKGFEESPEYNAIRPIRQKSAKSRICIVEGVMPQ